MANAEPKTGSKSTTKKKTTKRATKQTSSTRSKTESTRAAKSPGGSAVKKTVRKRAAGSSSRTKTARPVSDVRVDVSAGTAPNGSKSISREQLHALIAEAAYFKAESRGFRGGDPELDWREAETEVQARLTKRQAD